MSGHLNRYQGGRQRPFRGCKVKGQVDVMKSVISSRGQPFRHGLWAGLSKTQYHKHKYMIELRQMSCSCMDICSPILAVSCKCTLTPRHLIGIMWCLPAVFQALAFEAMSGWSVPSCVPARPLICRVVWPPQRSPAMQVYMVC